MKKVVILGGGYGGVLVSKKLASRWKQQEQVRITLIDKKPYHTLLTELHEVAAGRVDESSIRIDFRNIFAGRNVELVLDEIVNIDFKNQTLQSEHQTYSYDYLVIGTGSKPTFFGIEGASEHAWTLWSYEDAVRLRERIHAMFRLAAITNDESVRRQILTFVVVGAGFTGVEMIGELGEYKDELSKKYGINPDEVSCYVVDMAPKILPILPDPLVKKAEKRLKTLGVDIVTNVQITGVTTDGVLLGDGRTISAKTVIWSAGIEGSDLVGNLNIAQKGRQRIETNEKLQTIEHGNVYVVGDNIFFIPEGETRPVPQMVENAEQAAPIIAHNITAQLLQKPLKNYRPSFHGTMVCIGSRYGVAYVGMPGKMFALSGFWAMALKHFIIMVYLFQVCGLYKVYSYMRHEFVMVRHRRSFLGGHFAKRSSNLWTLPLRIYIGLTFIIQGLNWDVDPSLVATAIPAWTMYALTIAGILFVTGLFTTLTAFCTVVAGIILWSMGITTSATLWYVFASMALIGGAGSTFGLDYYVLPRLKKVWNRIPLIRRLYLYTD